MDITDDEDARALTGQLDAAARALLPAFDTGCWSLYSLGGSNASLHYHRYHVELLERLAARSAWPGWAATAARWKEYESRGGPCGNSLSTNQHTRIEQALESVHSSPQLPSYVSGW